MVGEPAFFLREKESEWGAFFLVPGAPGEEVGNGFEHRHRQRAPEAGERWLEHIVGIISRHTLTDRTVRETVVLWGALRASEDRQEGLQEDWVTQNFWLLVGS